MQSIVKISSKSVSTTYSSQTGTTEELTDRKHGTIDSTVVADNIIRENGRVIKCSGVGTGGSGGSMNRRTGVPELLGPRVGLVGPQKFFLGKTQENH